MREILRPFLLWSLLALVMALLGFTTSYHIPQLKKWVLNEIASQTQEKLQTTVLISELNFTLIPLGIELKNIHILPRRERKDPFRRIYLRRIAAGLDPLSLIAGNFGLSFIEVDGSDIQLRSELLADSSPGSNQVNFRKAKTTFMKEWVQKILRVPVHFLRLKETRIAMLSPKNEIEIESKEIELEIENRFKQLQVSLQIPVLRWSELETGKEEVQLKIAARGVLAPNQSYLQSLKVESGDSFVEISGRFQGEKQQFRFQKEDIEAKASLDLTLVKPVLKLVDPTIVIPKLSGHIDLDLNGSRGMDAPIQVQGTLKGTDLAINQRTIGNINAPLVYRDQVLMSSGITMIHPAGRGSLRQVRLSFEPEVKLQATLDVAALELSHFLQVIGAGTVPLIMNLKGLLDCESILSGTPQVQCNGKVSGTDFVVWSQKKDNIVVSVPSFNIDGKVTVDNTGVYPSGNIRLPNSEGKAEGQVLFESGFIFKFSSPSLNLADIKSAAGLKIEGTTAVSGSTEGDSSAATVDFEMQAKDVWISDFGLGTVKTQGGYKAGTLTFGNIEGNHRSSRYKGGVQLLLNDSKIQGSVTSQLLELNDLQRLLSRKAELPIQAVGLGRAEVKFEGPLDFSRLSYTMLSTFQSGTINDESFQEINFDVTSQNGNVKTQRAIVKKGRGSFQMKAEVNPDAILQAQVKSTDLTIQDFQTLSNLGLNVTGALISEMTLNGHILRPKFEMRNRLTETYIGDQPVADSEVSVLWNSDLISTEVRLLGKSLVSTISIPQSEKSPFHFRISTEKFNFAPLFGLLRSNGESRDFQGLLTMKGDLKSDPGGTLWSSRGAIQVSEFEIKQGRLALNAPAPLEVQFSGQHVSSNMWALQGDQTDLKLNLNSSTEKALDFSIQGKLELSLISFLTPFLEDLRGVLSGAATFRGSIANPNWQGNFRLQQGYIRIKDFPHAFENIAADLALNRNVVAIDSLIAQLGGGKLTAEGKIQLIHLNELPMDIKGSLEAVNLNVPKDVQTIGDGEYHLSGSWFPFTLQGSYRIRDGIMTKNLDAEETQASASKRRSSLLPQFLSVRNVDPLNFNLNVSFPQGYKIKNTLVDVVATGDLQIRGTNANPILSGDINLKKGGKLYFRETPFDIQAGTLKFNDPKENNPFVYLTGSTRVNQNATGKNSFYDLSLLAQGSSKNLSIQLRSQPPLSEQDIISLLALGVTTNDLQNQGFNLSQREQLNVLEKQQSLELGSAILSQNPVGKELKKRTGFDFKFSSAVDQIANDALPRIVVSRQWNPKVKTSASRTLGEKVIQDVKLEYLLSNNVSFIGFWNGRSADENVGIGRRSQDFFGLDLQYKVEFK